MKTLARVCALLCALESSVSLSAQVVANPSAVTPPFSTAIDPAFVSMSDAIKLRSDLAGAVVSGHTQPEAALARLRADKSPSGLKLPVEADFAYAAIDVGQRLLVAGRAAEAEKFFQEAEKSLDQLVKRTADAQAKDKAQFLKHLSFIRGNFLNKATQAKADIEQAVALQPEDKGLRRARQSLANTRAPITLPANPKG